MAVDGMFKSSLNTLMGGLVLFTSNFVFFMIPWSETPIHRFRDDQIVVDAIHSNEAVPGTYFLNRSRESGIGVGQGYYGWMTIHRSSDFSFASSIGFGLIQALLTAFCAAWLLRRLPERSYRRRAGTVVLMGCLIVLASQVFYWNWSWFSAGYATVHALAVLSGWALMGLVLAREEPVRAFP